MVMLLVIGLPLVPRPARADERRVAIVGADPLVADAIVHALAPWGLDVVILPGPAPSAELREATRRGAELASIVEAGAVIWFSRDDAMSDEGARATQRDPHAGDALWVFDAGTQQIAIRPLRVAAPFDGATAAAVALTVKTLLRSSTVAPSPERIAPAPTEPKIAEAELGPPPAPPAGQAVPDRVRLLLGTGARWGTSASEVEPIVAVGASYWPGAWGGRFGLGVEVRAGSGIRIDAPTFVGNLSDGSLDLVARWRSPAGARLVTELAGGAGAHLSILAGDASATHVGYARVNPSLETSALLALTLGPSVDLGLWVGLSVLLRHQRYAAPGASGFESPTLEPSAGLGAAMALP